LGNDLPSVFYTGSTWTGGAQPVSSNASFGAAGTSSGYAIGVNFIAHNGPYSCATFMQGSSSPGTVAPGVGRIVSAGLRAQYTGTTMNESGLYYCYHDPAHGSLAGCTTANIGAFGDANVEGISRSPCSVVVHGVNDQEMNFSAASGEENNTSQFISECLTLFPYSNGNNFWSSAYGSVLGYQVGGPAASVAAGTYVMPIGVPIGVIGITGVPGQTVHFEYIQHMEIQGTVAASALTATEADSEGAALVRTAALTLPAAKLAEPRKSSWNLMYSALGSLWNAAKPYVVPAIEAGVIALLG
jgi:hypothetical protein